MIYEEGKGVYSSEIIYFQQKAVLSCDLKCFKAWGVSTRPRVQISEREDEWAWLSDTELDLAPEVSPITEGDHNKPNPSIEGEAHNKWCTRECERSVLTKPGEAIKLPDFSERFFNITQE